jgi:hypothetical protein
MAFENVSRLVTTMKMAEVILNERVQTSRKAIIDRLRFSANLNSLVQDDFHHSHGR